MLRSEHEARPPGRRPWGRCVRKLHLVGVTSDQQGLLFTARRGSKTGGYMVMLDDTLLEAIAAASGERVEDVRGRRDSQVEFRAESDAGREGVSPPPASTGSRSNSNLTPREMQARLRAGRSIEDVAAEAGVDREWVERFAVPILAEQAQVVELARTLTYAKPRLGDSAQPLAESVVWNLSDRGVWLSEDVVDRSWGAYQLHDSLWMVRFRYRARGRDQEALWEFDVVEAMLSARNRLAAELAFVEKGRRRAERIEAKAETTTPARASGARPSASRSTESASNASIPRAVSNDTEVARTSRPRSARNSSVVAKARVDTGGVTSRKVSAAKTPTVLGDIPATPRGRGGAPGRSRIAQPGQRAAPKADPASVAPAVPRGRVTGPTRKRPTPSAEISDSPAVTRPSERPSTTDRRPETGAASLGEAPTPRRIGTTYVPPPGSAMGRRENSASEIASPAVTAGGVRAATTRLTSVKVAASRRSSARPGSSRPSDYPASPEPSGYRSTGLRFTSRAVTADTSVSGQSPRRPEPSVAFAMPSASSESASSESASRSVQADDPVEVRSTKATAQSRPSTGISSRKDQAPPATSRAAEEPPKPIDFPSDGVPIGSRDWDFEVDMDEREEEPMVSLPSAPPRFAPRPLPSGTGNADGANFDRIRSERPSSVQARPMRTISADLAGDKPVVRVGSAIPAPAPPDIDLAGRRRRGLRRP